MSHACSLGEPVHKDIIRLMLLLKAHALSFGKIRGTTSDRGTYYRYVQP